MARSAGLLRIAAWSGAALCLAVTAMAVFAPEPWGRVHAALNVPAGLSRPWAAAIAMSVAIATSYSLIELARMLGRIGQGAIFAPATTRHFRRFALLLMLAAAMRALLPPLAILAGAYGRHGTATLEFDGGDLLALLPIAVFFLVARLFDEAARLEDENRSIV